MFPSVYFDRIRLSVCDDLIVCFARADQVQVCKQRTLELVIRDASVCVS